MSEGDSPGPHWAPHVEQLPHATATISRAGRLLYLGAGKSSEVWAPAALGSDFYALFAAEARPRLAASVERVCAESQQGREAAFRPALGRWFDLHLSPWADRQAVVVVAIDATEDRRLGAALRAQEDQARALLRALPDMIFRLDRDRCFLGYSGPEGGPVVPPEVFLGRRMEEILPAPLTALISAAIDRALAQGTSERIEYSMEHGSELRHYEARLVTYAEEQVLGIVRDVTDLVRAQSARASSERNVIEVIEQLPDAVLIHRERRILYANEACARLLGVVGSAQLIGQDVLSFVHPGEHEKVLLRIREMVETQQPAPATELRLVRSDGTELTAELAPVQFVSAEGGRASLVVARDVTERKKLQERFILADRVASMGNLAAGLAHEINNPLTYVVGNLAVANRALAEIAANSTDPRLNDTLKALADARAGAERVRYIVSDLRAFSTPDRGEIESVDLRKVLDSAINVAWSEIRHRARLVREYGDTPNVAGSETRLGQVFLNLLLNAAQAIEEEGDAAQHRIQVVTRTDPDGRAHIEIRDTGRGFAPEISARMWDPFYTTKPAGEGTGLGLSICQSIITSIGGEISAECKPGIGTTFHVLLRPFSGESLKSEPLQSSGEDQPPERGRILVVDDEPVIATMVRRVLDGHDVYLMTSGRDALELCRELQFDLILVDLLMPDLTGMDLYEALRRLEPGLETRLVFMTAGAFTPKARNFLATVPNTVIEKPFEVEDLQNVVQRHLRALRRSPA